MGNKMSVIAWIKSKAEEWNRIQLKKEIDGLDGWFIEKSFHGRVPYRMIQDLWKEAGNKPINYQDGGSFFVRLPKYKGDTQIGQAFVKWLLHDHKSKFCYIVFSQDSSFTLKYYERTNQ